MKRLGEQRGEGKSRVYFSSRPRLGRDATKSCEFVEKRLCKNKQFIESEFAVGHVSVHNSANSERLKCENGVEIKEQRPSTERKREREILHTVQLLLVARVG